MIKYHESMNRYLKVILISIVTLVISDIVYGATLNDSIVIISADWHKTEMHTFRYSKLTYDIIENDTIITTNFYRDFTIEIKDSTQHLYLLNYNRCEKPKNIDSTALDILPLRLMTNQNGALIKILNWDGFLAWNKGDIRKTSNNIFPFASLLSFNNKKLKLNHEYNSLQYTDGAEIDYPDSIISKTHMKITQDFLSNGEHDLITVNTQSTYYNKSGNIKIPTINFFKQIIDSNKGWAIATYSEKRKIDNNITNINAWNIILLD